MTPSIPEQIEGLRHMNVPQLRERYLQVFGEQARSWNKPHLIHRIAWQIQANAHGGLSEWAKKRAEELADPADLSTAAAVRKDGAPRRTDRAVLAPAGPDPRLPLPGTVLTRKYQNRLILATVLKDGVEYEGNIYKSLSAVARAATGTNWNGLVSSA